MKETADVWVEGGGEADNGVYFQQKFIIKEKVLSLDLYLYGPFLNLMLIAFVKDIYISDGNEQAYPS